MPEKTLVVEGLKPLLHDFARISKTAAKKLRNELRVIAAPVAIDARFRESDPNALGGSSGNPHSFGVRTTTGIRVIVRQRGVSVEQTRRKSADIQKRRDNFGDLQMRRAFLPALDDNADAIERRAEQFLDRLLEGDVL